MIKLVVLEYMYTRGFSWSEHNMLIGIIVLEHKYKHWRVGSSQVIIALSSW